jgi:hypothetical protein
MLRLLVAGVLIFLCVTLFRAAAETTASFLYNVAAFAFIVRRLRFFSGGRKTAGFHEPPPAPRETGRHGYIEPVLRRSQAQLGESDL